MPRISADLRFADNYLGRYRQHLLLAERRMEAAAVIATDRASRIAQQDLRTQMRGAKLGRLGNAIGQTSDMQKGRIHRTGNGWSASGVVYVRSKSERTLGAIEAYTRGADIRPVRGRWLWIPSDDIPRVSKRERLTPALWQRNGLDRKIGPLVTIRSINGYPLKVVENVGVTPDKARSVKGLTKKGAPRKGQRQKTFLVAFVGIPNTTRAARVDVTAIMRAVQADLPRLFNEAFARTFA